MLIHELTFKSKESFEGVCVRKKWLNCHDKSEAIVFQEAYRYKELNELAHIWLLRM